MKDTACIVLAAGRGTRMKSDIPKVLHNLLGRPMIDYVLDSVRRAGITDVITVIGYASPLLKKALGDTKVVVQRELLGSGDAVAAAKKALKNYNGDLLIICGDTPLIQYQTIRSMIDKHRDSKASATVLTAKLKDPKGYGRILRGPNGNVLKIVEEERAELYEEVISEVNAGTYCFKTADLFEALDKIKPDNKKSEFFLTDAIGILHNRGKRIESVLADDPDEIIGINTRLDLAEAHRILNNRSLKKLMAGGVTIEDIPSTVIYPDVKIGIDTIIKPNTIIESDVEIGRSCSIGPFARIRPGVRIGDNVEIGNFVELVRTKVGDASMIKHHTYLGDAVIGKGVNIGAGTISANYDGVSKNTTVIEENAFIGVGSILIAPVRIGRGAIVGAGSVVPKNHNVPKGAVVVGVPARILKKRKKSFDGLRILSRAKSRDKKGA